MTVTLDITREHCPMTFVKVKLALAKLADGDILDVTLRGQEPLVNVPRSAGEQGHRVLKVCTEGALHHVIIEKHG